MSFTLQQWALGIAAALLVGMSKTGMPGLGLMSVPMMAAAFGPRLSVGALLPMLIMADAFAVAWFRRHCQWSVLIGLAPWVIVGMAMGGGALYYVGESKSTKDLMGLIIGCLILLMLALYLLNKKLGDKFSVESKAGVAACGAAAGFTTTVANAAGPVMNIYLTGSGLKKEEFIGTGAWYFFIVNTAKFPIYLAITFLEPDKPLVTSATLGFNLAMFPAIVLGAMTGRSLLSKIPQKAFETLVLILAAAGAMRLLIV